MPLSFRSFLRPCSEPDKRPKRHPQIVVRPVGEIHLVACLQPESKRPQMPFESAARIKRSIHVARAKIGNLARHATKRSRARVHEKLVEPALHHHKRPDPPVSQFNLRPQQSMQNEDVRVLNHNRTAGPSRAFPESLVEVVRHLPFPFTCGNTPPPTPPPIPSY